MAMNNVIIVGSGPAGISASLYTLRAGIKTTIFSTGECALDKAKEIENYYGFAEPVSGPVLRDAGVAQARRLGAEIIANEVVGIEEVENNIFNVKTENSSHHAKIVILTTGATRAKPSWDGITDYEGMGVSYCAVCDAFFFRGKDVAIAGSGPYALHEAQALLPLVNSITLCTDGKEITADFPPEIKIIDKPVFALSGDQVLAGIRFSDGDGISVSGLFVAIGTAGSSDLANTIGADVKGNNIAVNEHMHTSVPGLLAAGDCTGGMKQIAKAVYEGAVAGTEAVRIIQGAIK